MRRVSAVLDISIFFPRRFSHFLARFSIICETLQFQVFRVRSNMILVVLARVNTFLVNTPAVLCDNFPLLLVFFLRRRQATSSV
jgi:hypothetical protein